MNEVERGVDLLRAKLAEQNERLNNPVRSREGDPNGVGGNFTLSQYCENITLIHEGLEVLRWINERFAECPEEE